MWGNIIFANGRPSKINTYHMKVGYNKKTGEEIEKVNLNVIPVNYFDFCLTTNNLKKNFKIGKFNLSECDIAGYVTFKKPKVNDEAIINANNVILRRKPTTKSEIIGKINPFAIVKILSIDKNEKIEPWGEHHWYKVKYRHLKPEGYVFGAFLEPVEVAVK